MQEYARIGVKKTREPEMRSRYFDKNTGELQQDNSCSEHNKPSQMNTESKDIPPDLQIVTEEME